MKEVELDLEDLRDDKKSQDYDHGLNSSFGSIAESIADNYASARQRRPSTIIPTDIVLTGSSESGEGNRNILLNGEAGGGGEEEDTDEMDISMLDHTSMNESFNNRMNQSFTSSNGQRASKKRNKYKTLLSSSNSSTTISTSSSDNDKKDKPAPVPSLLSKTSNSECKGKGQEDDDDKSISESSFFEETNVKDRKDASISSANKETKEQEPIEQALTAPVKNKKGSRHSLRRSKSNQDNSAATHKQKAPKRILRRVKSTASGQLQEKSNACSLEADDSNQLTKRDRRLLLARAVSGLGRSFASLATATTIGSDKSNTEPDDSHSSNNSNRHYNGSSRSVMSPFADRPTDRLSIIKQSVATLAAQKPTSSRSPTLPRVTRQHKRLPPKGKSFGSSSTCKRAPTLGLENARLAETRALVDRIKLRRSNTDGDSSRSRRQRQSDGGDAFLDHLHKSTPTPTPTQITSEKKNSRHRSSTSRRSKSPVTESMEKASKSDHQPSFFYDWKKHGAGLAHSIH